VRERQKTKRSIVVCGFPPRKTVGVCVRQAVGVVSERIVLCVGVNVVESVRGMCVYLDKHIGVGQRGLYTHARWLIVRVYPAHIDN